MIHQMAKAMIPAGLAVLVAMLVPADLWGGEGVEGPVASVEEEKGVMELLRDVEIEMAAVREHAAKLEQMTKWPNMYSKSVHEFEWSMLKERFNDAGALVPKLQEAPDTARWQKSIVDDVSGLMKAMEVQIESGFERLNEVTAVEELHREKLYPVRIDSVIHYADMIDDLIEAAQSRLEATS